MNYVVFDTETTGLDKPFCYNIGYLITDKEGNTLCEREFVVEQIWHNLPLFATAYYADKRRFYVKKMRSRAVKLEKFGYICQQMKRDFRTFEVKKGFAYNSDFDDRVFQFNCDWYKCNNPFDTIDIVDIRGFVHCFLINDEFKQFCEYNNEFTESGNYSTTAQTVFRYLLNDKEYEEEHTALEDSKIERKILFECIKRGADINEIYETYRSIPREVKKVLHIKWDDMEYFLDYKKMRLNKERTELVLKN